MDQWIYPSSQENPGVAWKFMRKYNFLIRFVNDNKLCQNKGLVHFTKQKNTYSSGRKPNLFKWNVSNIPWLYISLLQCLNANLKKMQIINYNKHSINVILENNLLFVSIRILNIVGFLRVLPLVKNLKTFWLTHVKSTGNPKECPEFISDPLHLNVRLYSGNTTYFHWLNI